MIRRKDSMTALIAGKRADFQLANAFGVNAACKHRKAIAADTAASTEAIIPGERHRIFNRAHKNAGQYCPKIQIDMWGEWAGKKSLSKVRTAKGSRVFRRLRMKMRLLKTKIASR
jgi:hypothetical protein